MTEKKVAQARVQAYEGIKVETIKQNGSDGQKLMVSLFDVDKNGVLDKKEAEEFNRYNFSVKKGEITLYRKTDNGIKSPSITLKYDNFEEDILSNNYRGGSPKEIFNHFKFKNDKGEKCRVDLGNVDKKSHFRVIIDMIKGVVTLGGVKSSNVTARNIDLTVKRGNVEYVTISGGGNLNLDHAGSIDVHTDGKTVINSDKKSNYKVK